MSDVTRDVKTSPIHLDIPSGWREEQENPDLTIGDYATEAESAAALDVLLYETQMFVVHREVEGVYSFQRPDQARKTPRIDRVLVPTILARQAG